MQAKSVGTVLVSILAALIASHLMIKMSGSPKMMPAATQTESAYDRMMRTGTLRCGFTPWPPYFSLDPNTGELSGISKDMSDATAQVLGIKLEYVQITGGQQVQDMESGKIDAVCGDGPWVLSTIKHINYTKPNWYAAVYIYGRTNETRFKTYEDLNKPDVTFTALDADLSADLAFSIFPQAKVSTMASVTDPSQLMLNVTTGKADVVIVDPMTVSLFEKNNPGTLKRLIAEPVAVYGGSFSVRKKDTSLMDTINEATNAIINTGTAARILKKYDPDGTLFLAAAPPYHKP